MLLPLLLVLEICGGEMKDLSSLELMKRDDIHFQIIDDDYDEDDDDVEDIIDELGELESFDDDEDDEYY